MIYRIMLGLSVLDYRKSAAANLAWFVAISWKVSVGIEVPEYQALLVISELCIFLGVMVVLYVVESSLFERIQALVEARDSERNRNAAARLLSVLCEAVVHLDPEMRITKSCPQLSGLLLLGNKSLVGAV